jgi:putative ATP-binding cassette transporter
MKLFSFLMRYSPRTVLFAVLAGVVSGASNAALLALFNAALTGPGRASAMLIASFVGMCVFLPLTRFASEMLLTHIAQNALFDLRMRLCRQALSAPLRHLEEIGAARLMSALADDVPAITGTLVTVPLLCINTAVAIAGLVYLGWLSWVVLLAVLGFMVIGVVGYQVPVMKAVKSFRVAREHADALYRHFHALTEGTKELKLHYHRREAFLDTVLRETAASMRRRNIEGTTIYTAAASWGQVLVFVVVGLVLFVLPMVKDVTTQTLTGYTIILLYLMTPLQVIMNTVPNLSRATVSLKKVEELGLSLVSNGTEGELKRPLDPNPTWDSLELSGVTHTYHREGEKSNFTLGPISLRLTPGELVFLVGGNGSGKTTLAKLLAGLYVPESGEVRLNGELITEENRENFRQYFSMVFSDFHLFESLLGLDNPTIDEQAREFLQQLQLDHKVEITDGKLSTTDLSQGQRKRLALLTAYLEDRPIYVFDEWAADQDPLFKQVFYYKLLQDLKESGKTVVVISHDDRYYDVADRIIKLEYGRLEYDAATVEAHGTAAEAPLTFMNTPTVEVIP